jgi:gamma-glutamyltranspeptidase/glutathione hydrolase
MNKLLTFALLCTCSLSHAAFLPPSYADQGMVVSEQRLASEVGRNILGQGGNAIDAAVAVGYALAVVDEACGNIGGGGFMLIHRANKENVIINFREKAPQQIRSSLFFDKDKQLKYPKLNHYLYVGVPGTVLGLNTALKKYGSLSLKEVMAPAIRLARDGFYLRASDIGFFKFLKPYAKQQKNIQTIFFKNNKLPRDATLFKQPELAQTLQLISNKGSDAFYQGAIADAIVQASKKHGGVLTKQDFEDYRVNITKPIHCSYEGYEIITMPPPGSGITVCEILQVMQPYPIKKSGFHSAISTHYNAQAMRYAFMDRNYLLGDPKFISIPTKTLLSKQHTEQIRAHIDKDKIQPLQHFALNPQHERPQTTHFVVADKFGNAVSTTYTLNGYFGSKVIAGNTGFFLNNEMDDFSLAHNRPNHFKLIQGENNLIAPGKQPLSSMSPTIVLKNDQAFIILGAAGGSTIITSIVEAIENKIDFNMRISTAINMPKYHEQGYPDELYMEPYAFTRDTTHALYKKGYHIHLGSLFHSQTWGQMAAIVIYSPKLMSGATDNRRPGGAAIGLASQNFKYPLMLKKHLNQQ